jgi:ubiquinone/menaquinone biosynthesis C-methylase UbiE
MDLSEAEIQLLAPLDKAMVENTATDRGSLESNGKWFWIFLEDWSSAFSSLTRKGLIEGDERNVRLTKIGIAPAKAYNRERPDLYWYFYQRFYPAAYASKAHSRLCKRVFGKDLCQDGQVDMVALEDLLGRLNLAPEDHLLDLGCGAGVIAKYISDRTGVKVTGLDFAASAIAEAKRRTENEDSRLTYLQGDINALDFPAQSFDAVISLDTLYWVENLTDTLSQVVRTVKSGGQLGLFMEQSYREGEPEETLEATNTDLARALNTLGLVYETYDYTVQNAAFWRRIWQAATDLRAEFEMEGNGFISQSLLKQANEFLPAIEANRLTRYFYHVRL